MPLCDKRAIDGRVQFRLNAVRELRPDVAFDCRVDPTVTNVATTNEWHPDRPEFDIANSITVVQSVHAAPNHVVPR